MLITLSSTHEATFSCYYYFGLPPWWPRYLLHVSMALSCSCINKRPLESWVCVRNYYIASSNYYNLIFYCFRRTNPDTQPPTSRLGTRNMPGRSTFHSGQTRPRTQNGPDRSDPNSPGVGGRPSILSKLTSRFSKR